MQDFLSMVGTAEEMFSCFEREVLREWRDKYGEEIRTDENRLMPVLSHIFQKTNIVRGIFTHWFGKGLLVKGLLTSYFFPVTALWISLR